MYKLEVLGPIQLEVLLTTAVLRPVVKLGNNTGTF